MVTTQRLTLDEFLRLPEAEPALEYADGEVTQKVAPKARHSRSQYRLCALVNDWGEPDRLALAFPELRVSFAGASRVPDIAVFRWERIPRTETGELADDVYDPPDIAIEIISPGQSANALIRRCLWYVQNGVSASLLVDPADRSILVFRPGREPAAFGATDVIDLGDILPGFSLDLGQVFAALRVE